MMLYSYFSSGSLAVNILSSDNTATKSSLKKADVGIILLIKKLLTQIVCKSYNDMHVSLISKVNKEKS